MAPGSAGPRPHPGEQPMSSPGSVSHWLAALKGGDPAAAQPLWQRYYTRLVALAHRKLPPARRRAADEEDVVRNAFHSFFRAVARGRYPRLDDRDGLWRLLVTITARQALKEIAREQRHKRGGGTAAGPAGLSPLGPDDDEAALAQVVGDEPTPAFAAQVADACRRLLDRLGDESLRQVAVCKMEGYGNDEIAARLGCSRRTVARKLGSIRFLWDKEPQP